jgi:hypothetical protein
MPHSSLNPSHHTPQPSPTEQGHDETPHVPHKPQPSLARAEQGHDETLHVSQKPQPSQQMQPTHEQRVPSQEGQAREDEDMPEWEVQNKIPIKIRLVFVLVNDIMSVHKWYAHDQFKPRNQVEDVSAQASKEAVSSKLHQGVKKYPDVEAIKWSKDCPEKYERGNHFLPNQIMQQMPYGMRRFHDWYLRVMPTKLAIVQAILPVGTFGSLATTIVFDFDDVQTCLLLLEVATS